MDLNTYMCQIHQDEQIIGYCQSKICKRKGGYCKQCIGDHKINSSECQISRGEIQSELNKFKTFLDDQLNIQIFHQETQLYFLYKEFVEAITKLKENYVTNQLIQKHLEEQKIKYDQINIEDYSKRSMSLEEYKNNLNKQIIINNQIILNYLKNEKLPIVLQYDTENKVIDNINLQYFKTEIDLLQDSMLKNEYLKKFDDECNFFQEEDEFCKLIQFLMNESFRLKVDKLSDQGYSLLRYVKNKQNQFYFEGQKHINKGNYEEFNNLLKKSDNPKNHIMLTLKGKQLSKQEKYEESLALFEESQSIFQESRKNQNKQQEMNNKSTSIKNLEAKAELFQQAKKPQEAIKAYQDLQRLKQQDYYPSYQLSKIYDEQEDYLEALTQINKAIELNPVLQELHNLRIKIQLSLQNLYGCVEYIDQAIVLFSTVDHYKQKVNVLNDLNRKKEAQDTCKLIIQKFPKEITPYKYIAQNLVEQKSDFEEVKQVYYDYFHQVPSDKQANKQLVNISIKYNKPVGERIELYKEFIQINPNNCLEEQIELGQCLRQSNRHQEALELFQKIIRQTKITIEILEKVLIQQVKTLQEMNRHYESMLLLDQFIEEHPQQYKPVYEKTLLLQKINPAEANNFHNSYLVKNPNNKEALINKANFSDHEEAISILDQAIQVDIHDFSTYKEKGIRLHKEKRYQEELQNYQKYHYTHPQSQEALIEIIKVLKKLHKKGLAKENEVLEACDQLIKLDKKKFEYTSEKGEFLCRIDQMSEAIKLYDNFIKVYPFNFNAYDYKAKILLDQKNYDQAIKIYQDYLAKVPNHDISYFKLGKIYFIINKFEQSVKMFRDAVKLKSKFKEGLEYIAIIQKKLTQFEDQAKTYSELIELYPQDFKYYLEQGILYITLNKPDQAVQIYETIKKKFNFRDVQIPVLQFVQFAIPFQQKQNYKKAYNVFSKISHIDQNDIHVLALSNIYKFLKSAGILPYEQMFQLDALMRFEHSKQDVIKMALEVIDSLINNHPQKFEIYQFKGILLQEKNDIKECKKFYDKLVKLFPESEAAFKEKAQFYRKHDQNQAIKMLIDYQNSNPKKFEPVKQRCAILHQKNDYDKIYEAIDSFVKQNPSCVEAYLEKVKYYELQKKWIEAIKTIKDLVKLYPEIQEYYEKQVYFHKQEKQYDEALTVQEFLINKSPDNPSYRIQKADILVLQQSYSEALEFIQEINSNFDIILKEHKNKLLNLKATSLYKTKEYKDCIKVAQEILELNEFQDLHAYELQAESNMNLENYEKALELFNQLIISKNNEPKYYFYQAKLLQNLGKHEQASKVLDHVLKQQYNVNESSELQLYSLKYLKKYKQSLAIIERRLQKDQRIIDLLKKGYDKQKQIRILHNKYIEESTGQFQGYFSKIWFLMTINQTDKAHKILDKLLELHPKSIELLIEKSKLYLKLNQIGDAVQVIDKIIEQNPFQQFGYKKKIEILNNINEKNAQIQVYDQIIKIFPQSLEFYVLKSELLFELDKKQESIQVYLDYIKINPLNITVYKELSELYFKVNQYDDALSMYNQCSKIEIYSNNFYVVLNHCAMLIKQNKTKKAYKLIKLFTTNNLENIDALIYLSCFQDVQNKSQIYDQILNLDKSRLEIYHNKSRFIMKEYHKSTEKNEISKGSAIKRALEVYDNYIKSYPSDINTYLHKYYLLCDEKQIDQAFSIIDDYIKKQKMTIEGIQFKIKFLIEHKRLEEALLLIKNFNQQLSPFYSGLSSSIAREIKKETDNEIQHSIDYFNILTKDVKQDKQYYINKFKLFEDKLLKNDDLLIQTCEELIKVDPNDSNLKPIKYQLMILNWQLMYESTMRKKNTIIKIDEIDYQQYLTQRLTILANKTQSIIEAFDKLIELIQEKIKTVNNKAQIQQLTIQEENQKKDLEATLIKYHNEIIHILQQANKYESILELYESLINLDPSESNYENFSQICIKQGQADKAIEICNTMMELFPKSQKGYQYRGQFYEKELKEIDEEIQQYK